MIQPDNMTSMQSLVYSLNLEEEEKSLMWEKFEQYVYTTAVRYLYEMLSDQEIEIFNKIDQAAPDGDSILMLVAEHPELKVYYEKALARSYIDVISLLDVAVKQFGLDESQELLARIKGE